MLGAAVAIAKIPVVALHGAYIGDALVDGELYGFTFAGIAPAKLYRGQAAYVYQVAYLYDAAVIVGNGERDQVIAGVGIGMAWGAACGRAAIVKIPFPAGDGGAARAVEGHVVAALRGVGGPGEVGRGGVGGLHRVGDRIGAAVAYAVGGDSERYIVKTARGEDVHGVGYIAEKAITEIPCPRAQVIARWRGAQVGELKGVAAAGGITVIGRGGGYHVYRSGGEAATAGRVVGCEGDRVGAAVAVDLQGVLVGAHAAIAKVPMPGGDILWARAGEVGLRSGAGGRGIDGHGHLGDGVDGDSMGERVLTQVRVGDKQGCLVSAGGCVQVGDVLPCAKGTIVEIPVPVGDGGACRAEKVGRVAKTRGLGIPGVVDGRGVGHNHRQGGAVGT